MVKQNTAVKALINFTAVFYYADIRGTGGTVNEYLIELDLLTETDTFLRELNSKIEKMTLARWLIGYGEHRTLCEAAAFTSKIHDF